MDKVSPKVKDEVKVNYRVKDKVKVRSKFVLSVDLRPILREAVFKTPGEEDRTEEGVEEDFNPEVGSQTNKHPFIWWEMEGEE